MNIVSDLDNFPKPSITVDCVVFGYDGEAVKVLLINRKEEPFANEWTIPGGFLRVEEHFIDAVTRVLATKTGLVDIYFEQLFTFGEPQRDPRGRVLSVAYYALVNPKNYQVSVGQSANDAQWFDLDELPKLGFDHDEIIKLAYRRLQGKLRYQPTGFQLLNEEFTMPELQAMYERILKIELDRGNFRKKMLWLGIVKATGKKRAIGGHRSPDIYVFDHERCRELLEKEDFINILL